MISLKKINKYYFFLFLSFIPFLTNFFVNFNSFVGNKTLYLIYNIISYFLLIRIIRKKTFSFELFFFSFLLLSFWFKYSFILLFDNFSFSEGDIVRLLDIKFTEEYLLATNKSIMVIIFTFSACIISSYLSEFLLNTKKLKKSVKIKPEVIAFYKNQRFKILLFVILFLLIFWTSNYLYKIHLKGLVATDIPSIIRYLYAWLYTYALSVLIAYLIYVDFIIKNQKKYFLLGIFESFFSSLSIFSRAFLLTFFAYLRGFIFISKKFEYKKLNVKKNLKILVLIFTLFISSIYIVTELRDKNFKNLNQENKIMSIDLLKSTFSNLLINRWIGLDSLMSVSANKDLSFKLFISAFSEKKNHRDHSFYMKNFFQHFVFDDEGDKNLNTVILPGIVAFLFYSNSYFFVFFSVIFLILFCNLIEYYFLKISKNNFILSSIIGYALAMRLAHFGYLPSNTINFLFSFAITFLLVLILSKIVWKN